jgi:hypothetical protein
MKVSINEIIEEDDFRPFRVTFDINTYQDYVDFHDNVAINMFSTGHELTGEVYKRGHGESFGDYHIFLNRNDFKRK